MSTIEQITINKPTATANNAKCEKIIIDAQGLHYRELNRRIHEAAKEGVKKFILVNVNGQRYIGTGLSGEHKIDIHGVPGNNLGAFMNGPQIMVHNNAQDVIANTMNAGKIIVKGDAGDVLGYGMRGGRLFVRGNVGYRVGIHMKSYEDQKPVLIVGGTAGDFLGEYMAGGILIVLGVLPRNGKPLIGYHCATGIHGGEIYLRGEVDKSYISKGHASIAPVNEERLEKIKHYIEDFCNNLDFDIEKVLSAPFWRVTPFSHRPFGTKYAV